MMELRGIAWNHMRGFVSVVATAQRFEELHPDVRITWEKRSLQAFADASMEDLATRYDVIVMDHPHTALAATAGLLLPFEDFTDPAFLEDQARNSVGGSHQSYRYADRQWTLASDAATPISTWRPDLIDRHGVNLPETWDDVLTLAREGFVTVSAFPVDLLMHTYMFCEALEHPPFAVPAQLAPKSVVAEALESLRSLVALCAPECLERNPIRTADWMAASEDRRSTYCPFAYGYSNYSRPGYAKHVLHAGGLVKFNARRLRSTLGGAGIAVSARTSHPRAAMDYAIFTASPEVQRGIYFEAGGQPGHRSAWTDAGTNAASSNFFLQTLQTLDEAILRPKHPRYMEFQDAGSPIVHSAVSGKMSISEATEQLAELAKLLSVSAS